MSQIITAPKLHSQIDTLRKEIQTLRSLVIGIAGNDKEGEYRPNFVKKILKATKDETKYSFRDTVEFLNHLRK